MADWERVEVFPFRPAAEVARSMLEARGIEVRLIADDAGGTGGLSLSLDHGGVEPQVRPEQWSDARRLLGLPAPPAPS